MSFANCHRKRSERFAERALAIVSEGGWWNARSVQFRIAGEVHPALVPSITQVQSTLRRLVIEGHLEADIDPHQGVKVYSATDPSNRE